VPGVEFAGVVAKSSPIPKGCPFQAGDRVFGASQGAFAERVGCDWRQLLEIPENLSFEQAAGLSITYVEAMRRRSAVRASSGARL